LLVLFSIIYKIEQGH